MIIQEKIVSRKEDKLFEALDVIDPKHENQDLRNLIFDYAEAKQNLGYYEGYEDGRDSE